MFYTLPAYEFAPEGVDFSTMGAETGTKVWRAVRLTFPKIFIVIEFREVEYKGIPQTVLCSEVDPVIELASQAHQCALYLWVPATASASGAIELMPLESIERGVYRSGVLRKKKEAHIFHVRGGGCYVDVFGLEPEDISEKSFVYQTAPV